MPLEWSGFLSDVAGRDGRAPVRMVAVCVCVRACVYTGIIIIICVCGCGCVWVFECPEVRTLLVLQGIMLLYRGFSGPPEAVYE